MKIVFTGGGTLGHVMPNLYLIEELKKNNEIHYIGSNGIEKEVVKKHGVTYHEISATKLYRGKIVRNLSIPFKLIKAMQQAKKILKQLQPDLIVSKGGYVSLPVCLAGRKLKIPIVSHESDYSFGLANKIILKLSDKMCVNYEHLKSLNPNIVFTGPVISNSFKLSNIKSDVPLTLDTSKPTILIVGGSSGSKIINETVFKSVEELTKSYNIIHLVGKGNAKKMKYPNYNQFELSSNMPYLYSISDLVVGRAGAGVIFECAYMNKPMLLIPLQNKNSRGDQIQNAEYFKNKGGARILLQSQLNPTTLTKYINISLNNLKPMKESLTKLNLSHGKEKMLDTINEILDKKEAINPQPTPKVSKNQ